MSGRSLAVGLVRLHGYPMAVAGRRVLLYLYPVCSTVLHCLLILRYRVTFGTAGEQHADKEDDPTESHDEPENIFHAQTCRRAGEAIEAGTSRNQHIRPQQATGSLAQKELPAGVDSHSYHRYEAQGVQDDDGKEPCS
jgi:hypothetical protein